MTEARSDFYQQDLLWGHFSGDLVEHGLALPQGLVKSKLVTRPVFVFKPGESFTHNDFSFSLLKWQIVSFNRCLAILELFSIIDEI
jgi:hypothetical protein